MSRTSDRICIIYDKPTAQTLLSCRRDFVLIHIGPILCPVLYETQPQQFSETILVMVYILNKSFEK